MSLASRFWTKVRIGEGCWEWTAGKYANGYGKMGSDGDRGPTLRAHRVSWELANGPIPGDLCVLHRCDNRACVRPDHLFLGDRGDNFRDCLNKKRRPLGNPKLTAEQVRAIRAACGTQQAIADQFGVSRPTISLIKSGKTWSYV